MKIVKLVLGFPGGWKKSFHRKFRIIAIFLRRKKCTLFNIKYNKTFNAGWYW